MRLIDVDELKNAHNMGDECDKCETKWKECQYDYIYSKMDFCTWIDDAPTVDAVPVVRCGECKHRKPPTDYCEKLRKAYVPDDFYCKYGERKEKGYADN